MYTNMKIGRERRLAYARQIRLPNNNINSHLRERIRDFYSENYESLSRLTNTSNYESLSQLTDVTVGLISNRLLNNSTVRNSCGISYCTICQQDVFLEIVREIKCKHTYHINCIDKWMENNSSCPDCRFDLN